MKPAQILGIVASPHGGGSTSMAVNAMLSGAATAGKTTSVVSLSTPPDQVLELLDQAEGVVFGSPVYRASHTAQLASFLEEVQRGMGGETTAQLQGKAAAIVMTGASDSHFLATERLRATLTTFFAVQTLSPSLYFTKSDFDNTGALTSSSAETAHLHGRALADFTTATRASANLAALRPLV